MTSRHPVFGRSSTKWNRRCCIVLIWAFGWVALTGISLRAQEAKPDTYAGFEGKNVSRVEISLRPTTNSDAWRSLIQQKPNEPFSAAALRESEKALQNTHQFSKVDVTVTPEQSGLAVMFVLEPASYVGIISFPGVPGQFAYTQLLQTVNIPEQSPYFDDLLSQGQKNLQHFLQVQGYFSPGVQPEIQRDDPHRIVNLIYHVTPGPHAKVGDIHIDGVSAAEQAVLLNDLHSFWARIKRSSLKPGQTYSDSRIGKAENRLRGKMRSQNRLAPVVRHTSSEFNPLTSRADITFEVNPGPTVTVQVAGAHVSKRALRHQVPIYQEYAVDRDLVDEGERNLTSYFQTKGYFDAKVSTQYDQSPNSVAVTYHVDRGSKHRVEGVYFEGNRYFPDRRLQVISSIKKGRAIFGHTLSVGSFSNDLLRKTTDAIVALYKDAGFAKVTVTPKAQDFDPQVDVSFQINEGEQDKVNSLLIEGNKTEPRSVLSAKNPLNILPGKPYSPRLLYVDRNNVLAQYLDLGYLNANFTSTATPAVNNPHLFDVVYKVDEGPQARISDVVTLGQNNTRRSFIQMITTPNVTSGKPLSQGKLFTAESDLYNLSIFDWVSIAPLKPITDQTQEEVLVKVHESKRYSLDVGGGLEVIPRSGNIPVGEVALPGIPPIGLGTKFTVSQKSFWGPRFTFDLARHDIRGRAETATISTVLSRLDQSGAFTYADPHIRSSRWSSLFSLSVERSTQNPLYQADLGTASFQVERYLDTRRTKNLIFRYSFQRTDLGNILIPDLVLPEDRSVRLSTFSAEYIRDARDNPLDAHHGIYQVFNFDVTPTALGSSANFVRFLGQNAVYLPVRPWLTWATNVRLGLASPFAGSIVPLSERYFSGGPDSLRGFPIYGAGPQRPVSVCANPSNSATCTIISVPVGGNMLFILNTEARFPTKLINNLGMVLFYDGGNVYSNINFRQFVDDYTNTVGIGLRYKTPVGPVRFDVGYRITSVPGVNATQYFVTLGQSF